MQEMVENVSYFTIRPPEKSSYRLIIYAKDLDQQVRYSLDCRESRSAFMLLICVQETHTRLDKTYFNILMIFLLWIREKNMPFLPPPVRLCFHQR